MPREPAATRQRPVPEPDDQANPGGTRERILDIALDLFCEQGYDKTSLRQIAERLGFTQAAIYYHFAAKGDILMALHLRLHELGSRSLDRLQQEEDISAWGAVLCEMVDTMLANRRLFEMHERNQAAFEGLHRKEHDEVHEDMGEKFRRALTKPTLAARDRVRMSCALGALMTSIMFGSELGDLSQRTYAELLREAITDLIN